MTAGIVEMGAEAPGRYLNGVNSPVSCPAFASALYPITEQIRKGLKSQVLTVCGGASGAYLRCSLPAEEPPVLSVGGSFRGSQSVGKSQF